MTYRKSITLQQITNEHIKFISAFVYYDYYQLNNCFSFH